MNGCECPYNSNPVCYEEGISSPVCQSYLEHIIAILKGIPSRTCPYPDDCDIREIPIRRGIHSIPLSEKV